MIPAEMGPKKILVGVGVLVLVVTSDLSFSWATISIQRQIASRNSNQNENEKVSAVHRSSLKQNQAEPKSGSKSIKENLIWVMRSDGAQSCEPDSGTSLVQDAEELKKANIKVLDSKKSSDGKMHVQMCGASKGTMNAFLIQREQLSSAISLGFQVSKGH